MAEIRKSTRDEFTLFRGPFFEEHLRARTEALQRFVNHRLGRNEILNDDETELRNHLVAKYSIAMLAVQRAAMRRLAPREVDIDVSGDPARGLRDGQEFHVRGTMMTFVLPFEGESHLFEFTPSGIWPTGWYPYGAIQYDNTLHMEYTMTTLDAPALQAQLDRDLAMLEDWISRLRPQVDSFNSGLPGVVESMVRTRKDRILEEVRFAASLGIPAHGDAGGLTTYTVPIEQRIVISLPEAKPGEAELAPHISTSMFDAILTMCDAMSRTMERTPQSFASLDEEAIRDHLLPPLNAMFGLRAAGETFNGNGKTDILIQHSGANVFVGECKFWKGPKYMKAGIDQLLGNVTFRDTKTALLVFNRAGDMVKTVKKARESMAAHPNHKREDLARSETHFRHVFSRPGDEERDISVALLIFDVPSPGEGPPTLED